MSYQLLSKGWFGGEGCGFKFGSNSFYVAPKAKQVPRKMYFYKSLCFIDICTAYYLNYHPV